jgi:hypothetical protein
MMILLRLLHNGIRLGTEEGTCRQPKEADLRVERLLEVSAVAAPLCRRVAAGDTAIRRLPDRGSSVFP